MIKQAPNIYLPTEPEGDGVALPSLMSIVVHGAIVAFIVFSHQIPTIEEPKSIETTLVTADELAQMQSDAANSMAQEMAQSATAQLKNTASQTQSDLTNATTQNVQISKNSTAVTAEANPINPNIDTDTEAAIRRSVDVFMQSDEPADDFEENLPSNNGFDKEAFAEQEAKRKQAHDAALQRYREQMQSEALAEQQAYEEYLQAQYEAEQAQLQTLKQAESEPDKPEKPKRVDKTFPTQIQAKNSNTEARQSQSFSLQAQSPTGLITQNDSSTLRGSTNSVTANSGGKSQSTLAGELKRILKPRVDSATPIGLPQQTVRVSIQVDGSGNVVDVDVASSNAGLKSAIESAVRAASPLRPFVGTEYTSATISLAIENK